VKNLFLVLERRCLRRLVEANGDFRIHLVPHLPNVIADLGGDGGTVAKKAGLRLLSDMKKDIFTTRPTAVLPVRPGGPDIHQEVLNEGRHGTTPGGLLG
jgi:hypothetical protein